MKSIGLPKKEAVTIHVDLAAGGEDFTFVHRRGKGDVGEELTWRREQWIAGNKVTWPKHIVI